MFEIIKFKSMLKKNKNVFADIINEMTIKTLKDNTIVFVDFKGNEVIAEIDDSNMTDKQIQKRFDEAIAKFRIILDPEKTKRLIQKYIEKDRSDSHADVKNASRKVLEQITITMKAEEE